MSSLKFLKARIKSIKSTQKITKAMQLISASRLNKARDALHSAKHYSLCIQKLIHRIANDPNTDSTILTKGSENGEAHLILAISSDRGLCGAFNTAIIKKIKEISSKYLKDNVNFKIICIGKKAYDGLAQLFSQEILSSKPTNKNIDIEYINDISDNLLIKIIKQEYISCHIVYNKFISAITNETISQCIIPLSPHNDSANISYEPKLEFMIDDLTKRYFRSCIHHALLENAASEHSARMNAMDNATRNAKDMLKKLSNEYNKKRQSSITNELIEIISGAEAAN